MKTISPEKHGDTIHVKRAGNFNKLLVVRINEDFDFEAKLIDRKLLARGTGKRAKVVWTRHAEETPATRLSRSLTSLGLPGRVTVHSARARSFSQTAP